MAGRWLGDGWEMAGRTPVVLQHHFFIKQKQNNEYHQYNNTTIQYNHKQKEPDGWVVGFFWISRTIWWKSESPEDGSEMAGWLALAISKDCGCNSRSLQDCWEMTGWLAPTSSKYFGCNSRSPRDGWVVGPSYFQGFRVSFLNGGMWLGDGWEMAGRWLEEHMLY